MSGVEHMNDQRHGGYRSLDAFRYYYYDIWESIGDPRVRRLPMMDGGPWTVLSITFVYIYFVKVLGPAWMAKRQAFDLRNTIFWYNMFMVAINAVFFICTAQITKFGLNTWVCDPLNPQSGMQFKLIIGWFFLMSKFVDLFDTVFFVLRKKFSHVSALHVIHHSLVPVNVWMGLKYVPSESAAFMPFVNSFIHCLMYLYYALSTLGPNVRPYLWWKKYLTSMQIIQIVLVIFHCVHIGTIPSCNLPKVVFFIALPQALLILFLFCSFFAKSYLRDNESKKLS